MYEERDLVQIHMSPNSELCLVSGGLSMGSCIFFSNYLLRLYGDKYPAIRTGQEVMGSVIKKRE